VTMFSSEKCRDRAADCLQWAESTPSSRVRDILLDVARTWTRRRMHRREAGAGRCYFASAESESPAQFFLHHERPPIDIRYSVQALRRGRECRKSGNKGRARRRGDRARMSSQDVYLVFAAYVDQVAVQRIFGLTTMAIQGGAKRIHLLMQTTTIRPSERSSTAPF